MENLFFCRDSLRVLIARPQHSRGRRVLTRIIFNVYGCHAKICLGTDAILKLTYKNLIEKWDITLVVTDRYDTKDFCKESIVFELLKYVPL